MPLSINEVMADNGGTIADEAGDYDAWFEVHNASATLAWDLGGMYLTDDPSEPTKWRIPDDTRIPPGGTLLIWADGEREGLLHANFALAHGGGQIALFDRDVFGNAQIDAMDLSAQPVDVSQGRLPDGSGTWQVLAAPSLGWHNAGRPPVISGATQTPAWPASGDAVTVTATITDDGSFTPTIRYRAFAAGTSPPDYASLPMAAAGGGLYAGVIPPQADGTWVEYVVAAEDAAGMTSSDRPGWPQGDYRYVVGGMALSNNVGLIAQYTLPAGTVVPAGGYLILWADGDGVGRHLNFELSGEGEYVGLFDSAANHYAPIDAVFYDPQTVDVSRGRVPDGGDAWRAMDTPTPGELNRYLPPRFSQVARAPVWPVAGEGVTVTAAITAGTPIISATLWVDAGAGFQAQSLSGSGAYSAHIPRSTRRYDSGLLPGSGGRRGAGDAPP